MDNIFIERLWRSLKYEAVYLRELTYFILAGVAQSAHQGEVLGRQWSSLWAPIRVVVAVGCIMPLNDGFTALQHGIFASARMGSGIAAATWEFAVNSLFEKGLPISRPPRADVLSSAADMTRLLACTYALNHSQQTVKLERVEEWSERTALQRVGDGLSDLRFRLFGGALGGEKWQPKKATEPVQVKFTTRSLVSGGRYLEGVCGSFAYQLPAEGAHELAARIMEVQEAMFGRLVSKLAPIAHRLALASGRNAEKRGYVMPDPAEFRRVVAEWERDFEVMRAETVQLIAGGNAATAEEMRQELTRFGWVGAGAFFLDVQRYNAELTNAFFAVPKVAPPNYAGVPADTDLENFLGTVDSFLSAAVYEPVGIRRRAAPESTGERVLDELFDPVNWEFLDTAFSPVTGDQGKNWSNPLAGLQAIGSGLEKAAWASLGTVIATSGAGTVFTSGIWSAIGALVSVLLMLMFIPTAPSILHRPDQSETPRYGHDQATCRNAGR